MVVKGPLDLRMNIFPGSMQDAVKRGSGARDLPVTTVYYGQNVHFTGPIGQADAFDIRFPLETPFLYDRRKGQLVISEHTGDDGYVGSAARFDAQRTGFDRGVYLGPQFLERPLPVGATTVTKFSFRSVAAFIESIRVATNVVHIEFTVSSGPASIQIEGSAEVAGPYTTEPDVQIDQPRG